jgi:uncharacterized coiled-coil DUF342 family protein
LQKQENAMGELENYLARAAECRAQAEAATLQNVKERCLRAEEAWNGMAARVERHERLRAETDAAKAQAIAAAIPALT